MSSGSKGKLILKEFVFKSSKPQNSVIKPPDKHDSSDVNDPMTVINKLPSTKEQSIIPETIIIPEPIISDPKEIVCLDNYNTVLKMTSKEEDNFMISTKLMQMIGFFQLTNLQTRKLFGINIIKFVLIFEMIYMCVALCLMFSTICYYSNDYIYVQPYIQLIIAGFISIFKNYNIIKYSDLIWKCIKLTNINHFLYQFHDCEILKIGKKRSKSFAILNISLWAAVLVPIWITSPFILKNVDNNLKHGDTIYHYRHNIFNVVFPATDKFYNENFSFYYIYEASILLLWTHSIIIYDFVIISLCIVMTFQIKTIGHSYANFSTSHEHIMNNKEITLKQKESILIYDLKILIQDHQHVMRNTKSILKIFKTFMFVQVFVTSAYAISSWTVTVMNYKNGDSFLNILNLKIILTPFIFIYNFYLYCYLFDKLSEEKDAMHFALYCCDWEKRNIEFRKLIMTNMGIDRCNHMDIRLTGRKIINLVMFASVIHMIYSILSVLFKIL